MQEIRGLTGLRGIAALTVFLAHTRETLEGRGLALGVPQWVERLFLSGGRQVDIFFALSGFILALIYQRWFAQSVSTESYFKFLRRRFARIWPMHAFMLLLIAAFVGAVFYFHIQTQTGIEKYSMASFPVTLFMLHGWGFVGPQGGAWNPPSWSVSIEAAAYLVFPFFILVTSRLAAQRPWVLVGIMTAVGFAVNAITPWGLAGLEGLGRGLSEFSFGCAIASLYGTPFASWTQTRLGSALSVALLAVCYLLVRDTNFFCALCAAPLILSLCGTNAVSRLLGWGPFYFLGEISFSIYLGHFLFSTVSYRIINPAWMLTGWLPTVVGLIGIFAFVVILSTITYYTIEKPGRDLLGGQRAKYRAAASRTPSAAQ